MRPVNKGTAPRNYTHYGKARHDLAGRIGYYCSYCEMKVHSSIEVEHILPQNQGGALVDWNNFLLSCKYCNTIKSDHNSNLTDYVWPDRDNTDLVFDYSEDEVIAPKKALSQQLSNIATKTIDLIGLNRLPGSQNKPTEADTRWRSRKEIWDLAKLSYNKWCKAPITTMAEQIAISSLNGHYSIWCKVFENKPIVIQEIDKIYTNKGLYKEYQADGSRTIRQKGVI